MIASPKQEEVDAAFTGTNFGDAGATQEGRMNLVAQCVLKLACGFRDGYTIESICKDLRLLTKTGRPTKAAKQWAYVHVVHAARAFDNLPDFQGF